VLDGEFEVRAGWRDTFAGADGTGVVVPKDDLMPASAVPGAGIVFRLDAAGLEAKGFEGGELFAGASAPVSRESDQVWDQFKDGPSGHGGGGAKWSVISGQ
jgi:hypothetical protein